MRRLVNTAAMVGLAASGALLWILTEGASLAAAATRYRSGGVSRTQLVGHYGPGASAGSPGFVPMGDDVMAGFVALLLVAALAFMVVTFIRRRTVNTTAS